MSTLKCSECSFSHEVSRWFIGVGASAGCKSVQIEYFCKHPDLLLTRDVIVFKGETIPRNCPLKWKCRICGCTWNNACIGGCSWVEKDLCSKCV